jgi:peptide/nickel transport system substrate-binding protein
LRQLTAFIVLGILVVSLSCRRAQTEHVTVALPESFSTLDTLTSTASDSAAERLRNLMFNALVRKNENFDYVGELAKEITTSPDGMTITFALRDGVKFHNGKDFTSADVKYTFDQLFNSKGYKSLAFFDTVEKDLVPHISSFLTPDPKTVVITVTRPALKNQLLSNFVAIPIIPEGTVDQQKTQPIGSGPFKFVSFDQSQNAVELASNADYWEGAPKIAKLRIKTVTDASSLQAELQTGGVDVAPAPSNLPPDAIKAMQGMQNLKVEQFPGSNIQYLGFNTQSPPLDNVKVRQAIGYAIDREKIIKELLSGQANIASSILPEASWAYSPGTEYVFDPVKAKQLLQESGYKNEPIKFKYAAGNAAFGQYAQAIQNSLNQIGLNIEIETLDPGTIRKQLAQGQFQINTGVWIGGNQDPIFLRDLFTTGKIPGENVSCCNRSRYSNPEVDRILENAINEPDRDKAKELYVKAWQLISSDLPLYPLWYPANMVISNKRIGNVKIGPSGDWSFLKDITVQ